MAIGFPVKANYVTGEVLTATNMNDLSGSVNLLQSAQYAAGKNAIINGDFRFNQRNFTSTTTDGTYGFDRFKLLASSGATMSAQTFTPGTAPVSGYEAANFCRIVTTGQSGTGVYTMLEQPIEDVRTFAGQTITISFWAKAATGTPKIATQIYQAFGAGGSPSSVVSTYVGQSTLSTSWARYSLTIANPSISGKTIGTTANTSSFGLRLWVSAGSSSNAETGSLGIQSNTFDIWGVQVEEGSTASEFQTATGTIQGELAACQRYYWRTSNTTTFAIYGLGAAYSTTAALINIVNPVPLRVAATSVDYSTLRLDDNTSGFAITTIALNPVVLSSTLTNVNVTGAVGLTQYRVYNLSNNNNTAGYIGFSAEL